MAGHPQKNLNILRFSFRLCIRNQQFLFLPAGIWIIRSPAELSGPMALSDGLILDTGVILPIFKQRLFQQKTKL